MSQNKLRVALFSTPWEAVPPIKYGGTEVIVDNLAKGLTQRGHQVTVFATGDSHVRGKLQYIHKKPGYRIGVPWDDQMFPLVHSWYAFKKIREGNFDIVHNNFRVWGVAFADALGVPCVTTFHGDLSTMRDRTEAHDFQTLMQHAPIVAISDAQKKTAAIKMNWIGRVYNGIEIDRFTFNPQPQDYLLWVGRMNPIKGAKDAILAAKATGTPLLLAGKIDYLVPAEVNYFNQEVKPHLGKQIQYVGEVGWSQKVKIYKNAKALLMPIHWNEPFGLVMVEAMACGTPVIAFDHGSVREVVRDRSTGFVVNTQNEMNAAIQKINEINRQTCREHVEQHFSLGRMTEEYEKIYYQFLAHRK